jgi:hypothetical protein
MRNNNRDDGTNYQLQMEKHTQSIISCNASFVVVDVGLPSNDVISAFKMKKQTNFYEISQDNSDTKLGYHVVSTKSKETVALNNYMNQKSDFNNLDDIYNAFESDTYTSRYMMGIPLSYNQNLFDVLTFVPECVKYGGLLQFGGIYGGISTPFMYAAIAGTIFPNHCEDEQLASLVYVLYGTKHFYLMDPDDLLALKRDLKLSNDEISDFLSKSMFIKRDILTKYFKHVTVSAGQLLYIRGAIHCGYNEESIAISMNVLLPEHAVVLNNQLMKINSDFSFPLTPTIPFMKILTNILVNYPSNTDSVSKVINAHEQAYVEWRGINNASLLVTISENMIDNLWDEQCIICRSFIFHAYHEDNESGIWCHRCWFDYCTSKHMVCGLTEVSKSQYLTYSTYLKNNICLTGDATDVLVWAKDMLGKKQSPTFSMWKNKKHLVNKDILQRRPNELYHMHMFELLSYVGVYSITTAPSGLFNASIAEANDELLLKKIDSIIRTYNASVEAQQQNDKETPQDFEVDRIEDHFQRSGLYHFKVRWSDRTSTFEPVNNLFVTTRGETKPIYSLVDYCTHSELFDVPGVIVQKKRKQNNTMVQSINKKKR